MLRFGISEAHATLAQLFLLPDCQPAVFTSRSWIEAHATFEEKGTPVRYLGARGPRDDLSPADSGRDDFAPLGYLGSAVTHKLLLGHIGGAIAVMIILSIAILTIIRRYSGENFLLVRQRSLGIAWVVQLILGVAAF